jgi:hypothetical protein
MKTKTILHGFRNSALCAACVLLAAGAAEAKPGKDKGDKGGGKPGHSEKQKGGGKHDDKGKPDKGGSDHGDKGKDHKDSGKEDKGDTEWRRKSFRDDDRTTVIRYFSGFSGQERGLPPGLAKNYLRRKPLPPGWQKKVYGGYVITDDHRDYFHPLEYSLFPGLEVVPDTRLYLYGNRIVRVYEPRREVIDIIEVPTIRFD